MLASTPQPIQSWICTGVLAFSSPRPLNEGKSPTCPTATCSSLHTCHLTPLLPPGYISCVRKRPDIVFITAASEVVRAHRQGDIFCLRGGSGTEEHDARQTGIIKSPTVTTDFVHNAHGTWAEKGGAAFDGVALVSERSTTTGGTKNRVVYSILADGTLKVGAAQRKEPRPPTPTKPSTSPPRRMSTAPPPLGGAAATTTTNASVGPRGVLHGLRRRAGDLKAGIGKAAKGVTREGKAAVAGAGECAVRAGVAVRGGLMNTFLPAGYPGSVRPEYVRYRCWDIVQDLSSNLRGVLATQAVLEGMGVGRAGSTPLAATLQWMARDGASMIGGLLFTSVASANFGVNIKTWRLFADASNDIGLALEMLAPLPAFREGGRFLRLICAASVFKAACGVASGATGAAITEHWAVDNNIADVGAKNGAQHTVASLLGLGLSVWFARAVSDGGSASGSRVWGWYAVLTLVHLFANYAAMRTLALRSLNPSRATLLVSEYLAQALESTRDRSNSHGQEEDEGEGEEGEGHSQHQQQPPGERSEGEGDTKGPEMDWMGRTNDQGLLEGASVAVLSPFEAAMRERIFVLPGWLRTLKPWGDMLQINVGVSVRALVREADDLLWLTSLYHDEKVMVGVQVSYKPLGARMEAKVNLAFREDASAEDRLQAMFQANVIHHLVVRDLDGIPQGEGEGRDGVDRTLFLRKVTKEALRVTRKEFPAFRKALVRDGWDLSRVTLGGGAWVGRWGSLANEN